MYFVNTLHRDSPFTSNMQYCHSTTEYLIRFNLKPSLNVRKTVKSFVYIVSPECGYVPSIVKRAVFFRSTVLLNYVCCVLVFRLTGAAVQVSCEMRSSGRHTRSVTSDLSFSRLELLECLWEPGNPHYVEVWYSISLTCFVLFQFFTFNLL